MHSHHHHDIETADTEHLISSSHHSLSLAEDEDGCTCGHSHGGNSNSGEPEKMSANMKYHSTAAALLVSFVASPMSLAVYLKVPLFIYMVTTVAVMIAGWAALCYAATLLCIYRFLLLVKPEERSDTIQRIIFLAVTLSLSYLNLYVLRDVSSPSMATITSPDSPAAATPVTSTP